MDDLRALIRDVPDFPKPGIIFKDITPLLGDADAFDPVLEAMAKPWQAILVSHVVGSDRLEAHAGAVGPGDRVVNIDDVLATGGTGAATISLIRDLGAEVLGFGVLVELGFLGGRARITVPFEAVIRVD